MDNTKPSGDMVESGIAGIGKISWGSHFCQWYIKRENLAQSLVPYFQAGLRNNERCLWTTADPYRAADAKADLRSALPGFDDMLAEGRIEIHDYDEWYVDGRGFNVEKMVGRWLKVEAKALAEGYQGLRISGNTTFVTRRDWSGFIAYENAFNKIFPGRRIICLCSYSLMKTTATDIFEAVRSHQLTIRHGDGGWELLHPYSD